MALSKETSSRFDLLTQPKSLVLATYIWIDTTGELLRTKTRTFDFEPSRIEDLPWWDCADAFNTSYINTDIFLKPIRLFNDPFFSSNNKNKLVLCENFNYDKTVSNENKRFQCLETLNKLNQKYPNINPKFIIEQKYTMFEQNGIEPLDQYLMENNYTSSKLKKNFHYCSIGIDRGSGRNLAECHSKACLYAGINLKSFNSQNSLSEWKFEIGPCDSIEIGDHLVMARYILHRIAEDFNVSIKFEKNIVFNETQTTNSTTNILYSINDKNEENILKNLNLMIKSKFLNIKLNFSNTILLINNKNNNGLGGVIKLLLASRDVKQTNVNSNSNSNNGSKIEFLEILENDLVLKNGEKLRFINDLFSANLNANIKNENGRCNSFLTSNNISCFFELCLNDQNYNFDPYLLVDRILSSTLIIDNQQQQQLNQKHEDEGQNLE